MTEFKLIGTIGPSSANTKVLSELKSTGLSSFRVNLSHASPESLYKYYEMMEALHIQPSLDTQGAQVRVKALKKKAFNDAGELLTIGFNDSIHENRNENKFDIAINHGEFIDQLETGDEIKVGFDGLIVKVKEHDLNGRYVTAKVIHGGNIDINKALDISNKSVKLKPFTDFDEESIANSIEHNIKEIYVSFCDSPQTITQTRELLLRNGWTHQNMPMIVAKIENRRGILNLKEIIKVADAVLIDRGDLSREIKISLIPGIVKKIICSSIELKKPCYVATNVLDSMLLDPLPSRAEISDICSLLESGVSGFVLAAEIAIGHHPVQSLQVVKYMHSIFNHQKMNTGIIPSPEEIIPNIQEPLRSWL